MLAQFGAIPVANRVVMDGNVITGGGVTAGIDFGITVAAELFGPEIAKTIQLAIEYDPAPPFATGSPERAGEAIVASARASAAKRQAERQVAVERAAARLRELELAQAK
jgi:cyclohexyl-isocyanide hydratase